MKRNKKLRICPFCGSKARLGVIKMDGGSECYDVECTKCGALMLTPNEHMMSLDKNDIIKAWNQRVPLATLD